MKNIFIHALKIAVVFVIIFWLFKTNKFNISILYNLLNFKLEFSLLLFSMIFAIIINNLRWKILLESKLNINLNYIKLLSFTFIGQFFNTFLPGAVTGDAVKVAYIKKEHPSIKISHALLSAFLDRIIGLFSLLSLMSLTSFILHKEAHANQKLIYAIYFNYSISAIFLILMILFFLPPRIQSKILNLILKIPYCSEYLSRFFITTWSFARYKNKIILCFLLGIFAQTLQIYFMWNLFENFITTNPSFPFPDIKFAFIIIPLSLITIAIPLAPAGIGVGHLAFQTLFSFIGVSNGASVFNIFVLSTLIVNLLGIFPFIFTRKKIKKDNLNKISNMEV